MLILYFGIYFHFRTSGRITHQWGIIPGKVNDPALCGHIWNFKFERGQSIFIPAMALEMAIRDLGPAKSK